MPALALGAGVDAGRAAAGAPLPNSGGPDVTVVPTSGGSLGFRIAGGAVSVDPDTAEICLPLAALEAGLALTLTSYDATGAAVGRWLLTLAAPEPAAEAPAGARAPALSGSGLVGAPVTLDPGDWTGSPVPALGFQWRRDGADLPGATGADYLAGDADDATQAQLPRHRDQRRGQRRRRDPGAADPAAGAGGGRRARRPRAGAGHGSRRRWRRRRPSPAPACASRSPAAARRSTRPPDRSRLPTDTLRADEAVTVTASNSGGSAGVGFRVSVAAALLPPVAVGTLPAILWPRDGVARTVSAQAGFGGAGLGYALLAAPAGATINPGSGLVTIPTDVGLEAATVTVRASNAAGSAEQSFAVTVRVVATAFDAASALAEMGFVAEGPAPGWSLDAGGFARLVPAGIGATHGDWSRAAGDGRYRALVRWTAAAAVDRPFCLSARLTRSGADFRGLRAEAFLNSSTGTNRLELRQYLGSGTTSRQLGVATVGWANDAWYWVELELDGATLRSPALCRGRRRPRLAGGGGDRPPDGGRGRDRRLRAARRQPADRRAAYRIPPPSGRPRPPPTSANGASTSRRCSHEIHDHLRASRRPGGGRGGGMDRRGDARRQRRGLGALPAAAGRALAAVQSRSRRRRGAALARPRALRQYRHPLPSDGGRALVARLDRPQGDRDRRRDPGRCASRAAGRRLVRPRAVRSARRRPHRPLRARRRRRGRGRGAVGRRRSGGAGGTCAAVPAEADWRGCVALAGGGWHLGLAQAGNRDAIAIRYRLTAAGAWSPASEDRKPLSFPDLPVLPRLLAAPALAGAGRIGQAVAVLPGLWIGAPALALQWCRDGVAIAGASAASYRPGPADDRTALTCRITATTAAGSLQATTAALGVSTPPRWRRACSRRRSSTRAPAAGRSRPPRRSGGGGLRFTVAGAGATVDPLTGVVSIPTDVARSDTVLVTATNSGGSAALGFAVTVEAAETPVGPPALEAAEWSIPATAEIATGRFAGVIEVAGTSPAANAVAIEWTDAAGAAGAGAAGHGARRPALADGRPLGGRAQRGRAPAARSPASPSATGWRPTASGPAMPPIARASPCRPRAPSGGRSSARRRCWRDRRRPTASATSTCAA